MDRERADVPPSGAQHRCLCCGGIIEIPPDQDLSVGLNLTLGLVSDECALICDDCTTRLIAARPVQKPAVRGRRKQIGR